MATSYRSLSTRDPELTIYQRRVSRAAAGDRQLQLGVERTRAMEHGRISASLVTTAGLLVAAAVGVWFLARGGHSELLVAGLVALAMAPVVWLVAERGRQQRQLAVLREEALRAEVAMLRAQIDPHFFFNTLNNLYALVLAGSERAPQLILELSELLRFTIYEGRKDHVALRDEVAYLEHYLALQRLRARAEDATIELVVEVEDELLMVPPLMLILLIENAVKHGLGAVGAGGWIRARLRAGSDWLELLVENSIAEGQPASPSVRRGGVGLDNLRRRLELLYPGRHQLELDRGADRYRARVRIEP